MESIPSFGYILIAIWGVMTLIGLVGVTLRILEWHRRVSDLKDFASQWGMAFDAKPRELPSFGGLPLLSAVNPSNLLSCQLGNGQGYVFDCNLTKGENSNSRTYSQTVAALRMRGVDLPFFVIEPRTFGQKLWSPLTGALASRKFVDLSTFHQFSSRYRVACEDEDAVKKLFGFHVIDLFKHRKVLTVQGKGEWLLAYRQNKEIRPRRISEFLEEVNEIATKIAANHS